MASSFRKSLSEMSRLPVDGVWEITDETMRFSGEEFDYIQAEASPPIHTSDLMTRSKQKLVAAGIVIFGQNFEDGLIQMQIEFDDMDFPSAAGLILQHDPHTKNMLAFIITGGGLPYGPGVSGFQFKLQSWGARQDQLSQQQAPNADQAKIWTTLFQIGLGSNLKAKQLYLLEASVRGAAITLRVNGVEIGRHRLPFPFLPGFSYGAFCLSHGRVTFKDIIVETTPPKAFVVMQFQTPEYESLYRDVIEPVCRSEGILAYRADSTHLPGLIIEDIKKANI